MAGEVASFLVDELSRSPHVRASRWRDTGRGSPHFATAAHAGVEIAWCSMGCVVYEVGSRTLELAAGAVVVIPEGVEHRTRLLRGAAATSIKLDAELVLEAKGEIEAGPIEPGIVPHTDVLARLGSMLAEPASGRREAPVDDVARAFVRRLLEPAGDKRTARRDPRIQRVLRWVDERISEPLEIADLARAAGMSRYHFSRSFRAELGLSPYQWLLQKRVEHAAELLRRRRLSVTEAAFEVGFSDLSRFARAFRAEFGCPPSAFAA
ncbi:MAG: helix-turn-helix transcriptional regulator [Polyangiaceae bacterium]|nr:helix-turn-helix transcriptional regulator [Polyangiaceae bacterium]